MMKALCRGAACWNCIAEDFLCPWVLDQSLGSLNPVLGGSMTTAAAFNL